MLVVLRAIVVYDSVHVVNGLVGKEIPPQQLLHHEDVFEHVSHRPCAWVFRLPNHHVTRLVPRPSGLPMAVRMAGGIAAHRTRCGLPLLGRAASAAIPGSARRAPMVTARRLECPCPLRTDPHE